MKYLVIVFLFGFLISFLAGVIAGNPFLVILLKSIISGFLLAGLGYGGQFVLKKYIPELFEQKVSNVEAKDDTMGEEVDIVIPEENPHDNDRAEMVEEVESVNDELSDESVLNEPIKEESIQENEEVTRFTNASNTEIQSEEEDLPDINGVDIDVIDDFGSVKSERSKTVQSDLLGTDVDPATLAKAVRSFMKKDEER